MARLKSLAPPAHCFLFTLLSCHRAGISGFSLVSDFAPPVACRCDLLEPVGLPFHPLPFPLGPRSGLPGDLLKVSGFCCFFSFSSQVNDYQLQF